MATASLDQQIVVWDVAGTAAAVVLKHSIAAVVLSLAWHPASNELLAALTDGTFMRWAAVIPGHMVAPHVAMPEAPHIPGTPHSTCHAAAMAQIVSTLTSASTGACCAC